MDVARRIFMSTSAEIIAGAVLASGLQSCRIGSLLYSSGDIPVINGTAEIIINNERALQTVGGAVKKRFANINNGNVILIVRSSEHSFNAYAAQCTHWGAEVELPHRGIFVCPFHGSQYSAESGSVIEGPAAESLLRFSVTFDESSQRILIE